MRAMCRSVDIEAMLWNLDDSDVRRQENVSVAAAQVASGSKPPSGGNDNVS